MKFNLLDEIENEDVISIEKVSSSNVEIIDSYEHIKNLAITDEEEAKNAIAVLRNQASLMLSGRKLKQAEILMSSIENNISIMNDEEVLSRVKENTSTAMDFKFLAEANEKSFKLLENLMRIDSADTRGTAAYTQVMVRTVDRNGNETSAFIESKV